MNVTKAICNHKIAISMAESRRLVGRGIVSINHEQISEDCEVNNGDIVSIGNRRSFTVGGDDETGEMGGGREQ